MGKKPHVMVIPCPAQGHVAPLMKFAYKLTDHGIKVTLVNTGPIHAKIMAAIPKDAQGEIPVNMVSVSNRLEDGGDQKERFRMTKSMRSWTQCQLQDLIESINRSCLSNGDDAEISCVVADIAVGWTLEVARKMGIKRAAFACAGVANLAMMLHARKLIEAGIISSDGIPIKDEFICLSEEIPSWHMNELPWSFPRDPELQKFIFTNYILQTEETVRISDWVLTNSFYELESPLFDLFPNILPIGPLLASNHPGHFAGNLLPEESNCITWLDKQPLRSVIYAAFGSTGVLSHQQFNELALGLELTGLPFLWVVRPESIKGKHVEYPEGFRERTTGTGHVVEWAPQEKVLSHPSVACFLSHCGWNSSMEGVGMGVPIICFPYFTDQFHNRSYICETWKVGVSLVPDEDGVVTRHEIREKIERVISDEGIKANSMEMKDVARKCVEEDGSSFKNLTIFIEELKR